MYWDCREFEAAGSPGGDVWHWGAALSEAGAPAALEEAAVGLVTGLLPMATLYQRIEVAGVEYRSSSIDGKFAYQNSGVSAVFALREPDGQGGQREVHRRLFGKLKMAYVVQVNLGGEEGRQPYILLNVDWFATQRRHPHCRDVHLVKLSEGFCQDEATVPPDLIDAQVFYAEDPEFPGELAVFLRRTSSYAMPMHLRAGVSAAAMRAALA